MHISGIESFPYFAGIIMADFSLWILSTFSFIILILILKIEFLTDIFWTFLFAMILFGWTFVNMNNFIGFFFSTTDSSLKYSTYWMILFGLILPLFSIGAFKME
jgi:hypothetical protein